MRRRASSDAPPPAGSARVAALRLLGRRDYTSAEIRSRLRDHGYLADAIDRAIQDLQADGAIDDERVARGHVRTASAIKGRGKLRIRRELEARGISRSTAEAATADLTVDDERAAVERFVQRKIGGRTLDQTARRRLYQQLIRRGFSADIVMKVLRV